MAPVKNGRLLFKEIPTGEFLCIREGTAQTLSHIHIVNGSTGYPEPGKTTVYDDSQTIDLENAPLNGGFLAKTLVLSIDPYLRGKMRDPSIPSYSVSTETR